MGWFDAKPTDAQGRLAQALRFALPRAENPAGTLISRLGSGAGEPAVTVGALRQFLATVPDDWELGVELDQNTVAGVPLPARTGNLVVLPPSGR